MAAAKKQFTTRLYAPHVFTDGKWQQVEGKVACSLHIARVRYQNWLLAPYLGGVNERRELRPVKPQKAK